MTAKEYLDQLKTLNAKIEQLLTEKKKIRESLTSLSSIDYSKDRVAGGNISSNAAFVHKVERILDLEKEIDDQTDKYVDLKQKIIGQIHSLQNANHIKLLYKFYVEEKRLLVVAEEMNYSYSNAKILHKNALKEFESLYPIIP